MKIKLSIMIFFISFSFMACQEGKVEKSDLKTQKDKVSYSIGLDIGKNMKKQFIEVEPKVFLQGLMDGLQKDSLYLMNDQEIQQTMMAFQQEMFAKQSEKQKELGAINKKEGDEFLAANAKKEGVVVLPSGLQYKVIKSGNGPSPDSTDKFVANYVGKLVNGTEFDNSIKRGQPLTLGVKEVIPGWTEALMKMHVGDKWELYIPANLAYGEPGRGQVIPPNATLIFEMELLGVEKNKK